MFNKEQAKAHLKFILENTREYEDGKIEIGSVNTVEKFDPDDIDAMVDYAEKVNKSKNTYLIASILSPDCTPFGRSSDDEFYATYVLWCDIDEPHDPEALKELYKECPPNAAVITGTKPHRRVHLWWRLVEPVVDTDLLREALSGVAAALGGDTSVTNPVRLMRLAGSVSYPDQKKMAKGYEQEQVTFHHIHDIPVAVERFVDTYPYNGVVGGSIQTTNDNNAPVAVSALDPRLKDGRDKYMSDMVYASIIHLAGELKRWPEPQEVFNDCWPVYESKVVSQTGKGLDREGRGQKAMQQKIYSKLRAFKNERLVSLDQCIAGHEEKPKKQDVQEPVKAKAEIQEHEDFVDPETGELLELFPYKMASDIKPVLKSSYLIKDLLSKEEISVIYGESNVGKTFFMLDLALHIASGTKWRDHKVKQGGVVYVACEGGDISMSNRIDAAKTHIGASGDVPFALIRSSVNFLDTEATGDISKLFHSIKHIESEMGKVDFVVVDTLAQAMAGGDENDGVDMGVLVANAQLLRDKLQTHVSFVHHTGKDASKGGRGHSSLKPAIDTEMALTNSTTGKKHSNIEITKQRDLDRIDNMSFELKRIIVGLDDEGDERTTCVVNAVDYVEEPKTDFQLTAKQKCIYEAIVNTIIDKGVIKRVLKGTSEEKCITYDQLAGALEEAGYYEFNPTKDKSEGLLAKEKTLEVRMALKAARKINFDRHFIWMVL